MVTNVAIIAINNTIRTSSGMCFRSVEISTLEQTSANVAATPIEIQFATEVDTASAGQSPIMSFKTQFRSITSPQKVSQTISVFPVCIVSPIRKSNNKIATSNNTRKIIFVNKKTAPAKALLLILFQMTPYNIKKERF
jgi:hypothetical protein